MPSYENLNFNALTEGNICIFSGEVSAKTERNMMMRSFKAFALVAVMLAMLFCQSCGGEKDLYAGGDNAAFVSDSGIGLYDFKSKNITHPVTGKNIHRLVFSPDGKYLFYKQSSDLFCLDLSTSISSLAAANASPVCFKDGLLICASETNGITRYNPQSGESGLLVKPAEVGKISDVLLSPDKSRMLYTVCSEDVGRIITLSYSITIPGSNDSDIFYPAALTDDVGKLAVPVCWLPDGGAILVKYGYSGSSKAGVMTFPVIEGATSLLKGKTLTVSADAIFRISADSKHAAVEAFRASDDEFETIALIDLEAKNFSYIPSGSNGVSGLDISADASMIAYASGKHSQGLATPGIYIYSSNVTLKICGGDGISYICPIFSENSRELYFIGISTGKAYFYSALTNTAGCNRLFGGIAEPDGVYAKSWYDMFAVYNKTAQ